MWQERLTSAPPFLLNKPLLCDLERIKSLRACLEDGVEILELHPQFLKNTAYISRFIKLFRSQFRSSPILQFMRKIKLAIEKVHMNNTRETVANVLSGFPVHLGTGYDLELPTKEYFDYVMARILAHAQIMLRLVVCSKKCALYFVHHLQNGHFLEIATMMIGLLGHVWHQARSCLLRLDPFYNQLITYQQLFTSRKMATEEEIDFPITLTSFIGEEWKEEVDVVADESSTTYESTEAFKLIAKEENSPPQEVPLPRKVPVNKMIVPKEEAETIDMGEVISRSTMKPTGLPEILSKRSLISFLKTENELRGKKSSKSQTQGISQFHWEKFRQTMERKMRLANVSIKDVFDKEWTELQKNKS